MTNLLLSNYDISKQWCFPAFSKHIRPGMSAVIIALAFREREVRDSAGWDKLFGERGACFEGIVRTFAPYGVRDIRCVDYFRDTTETAAAKIQGADILYLPWGMPDKFMARVLEKGLYKIIEEFRGVVVGIAAGAQVQLATYHMSPGKDYSEFTYSSGFRFVENFDIEPHYNPHDKKGDAFALRAARERGLSVLAIEETGAVVVKDGAIEAVGDVYQFKPDVAAPRS